MSIRSNTAEQPDDQTLELSFPESTEVNYKVPESLVEKLDEVLDFINLTKARLEENTERWLKPKEAAKYLKVSENCLMRDLKHIIGYSRTGRMIQFDKQDLDEYRLQRKIRGGMYGDPNDLDEFKNKRRKSSQGMATRKEGRR